MSEYVINLENVSKTFELNKGENGFKIIDEELLSKNNDERILESIIATYRNLRKNYERRFRNEEAQKFFLRALKLKKLYTDKEILPLMTDLELIVKNLEDLRNDYLELENKVDTLEKLSKTKQGLQANKPNQKL